MSIIISKGQHSIVNVEFNKEKSPNGSVNIQCGANCEINIEQIGFLRGNLIIATKDNCKVKISQGCMINGTLIIQMNEPSSTVLIGEDCLFSSSEIWTSDFHSIIDIKSGKRIIQAEEVSIGDHCWVGNGPILLKNSGLGSNSVAAVKSVVTKLFGDNVVIGGNPAKVIKSDITWDHRQL